MKKDPRLPAMKEALHRKKEQILEAHTEAARRTRSFRVRCAGRGRPRQQRPCPRVSLQPLKTERQALQLVEEALARIPDGNFGTCRECSEPMSPSGSRRCPGPSAA